MHLASRIVSQPCDAAADAVYDFAHRVENLPRWAAGLTTRLVQEDGQWFTDTPQGRLRIDMAPRNAYRVMDHDVTMADGLVVHNAFRVTPTGDGSLLSFVVLRLPGYGDAEFDRDCGLVAADLRTLATLVQDLAVR
jgi:hypothetical protein